MLESWPCQWKVAISSNFELEALEKLQLTCRLQTFQNKDTSRAWRVHPTWAGTYILDACVYLFPTTNFALIDRDCVPVTLFEVQELCARAISVFLGRLKESRAPETTSETEGQLGNLVKLKEACRDFERLEEA